MIILPDPREDQSIKCGTSIPVDNRAIHTGCHPSCEPVRSSMISSVYTAL